MSDESNEARSAPGSTKSLRTANQNRVVEVLRQHVGDRSISQADIARATQLAPATVSNIVRDLSLAGMVETTAVGGRRGTTVRIARNAGLVAGVDVGEAEVRVALGDLSGAVVALERRPLAIGHTHHQAFKVASELLEAELAGLGTQIELVSHIVLGVPTPLVDDALSMTPAFFPTWEGVDARAEAEAAFGRPTSVENDANLGALAEQCSGAGRGHETLAYVKAGAGVCAGLILEGRVFRGAHGVAGELGHLTVDERGPLCRCGSRGCLEAYASATMARASLREQFPDATVEDLVRAAQAGHRGAIRVFEDAGLHLGWGLAMIANLLNPSCIVVGGEMAIAGDLLLDPVRVGMRRHALSSVSALTQVVQSQLGDHAGVLGAVQLAVQSTELNAPRAIG